MNVRVVEIIETLERFAGLDQRRDTAREAIAFRVALAKLGGEQIRQLDLRNFRFDLGVRHLGVEIMLKSFFAE